MAEDIPPIRSVEMPMTDPKQPGDSIDGPAQGALFRIEGPDEDGCVWACSANGREDWCFNLGPRDPAAEELRRWLNEAEPGA